jgi:hypothetical protein
VIVRTNPSNREGASSESRLRLHKRWHSFRNDCARWGWVRALVLNVMARMASWLSVAYVVERDLRRAVPAPNVRDTYRVRLLEPEDLRLASGDPELHLSPAFVREALARGDRGHTHGIGFIDIGNYASIAAFARAGSVPVGIIGYVRLFGRVATFRTPGARRRGISFQRAAAP